MIDPVFTALVAEYEDFAEAHDLWLGSCDEMLIEGTDLDGKPFNPEQTAWLNRFLQRWETVEAFEGYVRKFGLGFHVDTRGADYVTADGARALTDAQAQNYDAVVAAMHDIADPYEVAIAVWREMRLIEA